MISTINGDLLGYYRGVLCNERESSIPGAEGDRGIERLDLTSTKAHKSDLKNREGVP